MPRASRVDLFARSADTIATFHRLGEANLAAGFSGWWTIDQRYGEDPLSEAKFLLPFLSLFFFFPPFLHSTDQLSRQSTVSFAASSRSGDGGTPSRKSNETENSTDENVARPGARLNILLLLVPGIGNDLNIPWNEATSPRSRSPPFHRNFISVEINRVALPLCDCSS